MRQLLKFIGIVLVSVVVLIILALTLLAVFVSPNRLKPIMTEQVMKYTGRQLTIDGDMSWTFFPYLGVKVGHMELGNPSGFKQKTFAEMSGATVGVKLMPLLHGQVESSGITLNGMKLVLVKNASGEVNWNFQQKTSGTAVHANTSSTSESAKKAAFGLAISNVDVSDASATYTDEQLNKSYDITNFELHAKNINLLQPFPLKTSFDFATKNPAASGHLSVGADITLNLDTQLYSFRNLVLDAKIQQQGKNLDINVTGNVIADVAQQTLQWTDFQGKVANIKLDGKLGVTHLNSSPVATGHMTIAPFDLRETMQSMEQNVDNLQVAKNVQGDIDFSAAAQATKAQANLRIETLQAAKLVLSQVNLKAVFQNGVLNILPVSANLYQGTLTGQAKVDLNSTIPQISLQAKLSNVQAEPLLKDLGGDKQKLTVRGAGNFELQVTTLGTDSNTILRNLNGSSRISFTNGTLVGLDAGYLVDSAYALAKKQSMPTNSNQTTFGNLTGTAVISRGVVANNDLLIDSPRFTTNGKGTIDLVAQKIDYTLQITVKKRSADEKNDLQNLYGIAIPVLVTGSLSDPSIRPDSGAIAKAVAAQEMQKVTNKVQEKIQDQIKQQLPEKAGDLLKGKAGDVLNNFLSH